jgi:GxxExxY protein
MNTEDIITTVIDSIYTVRHHFAYGYLESVYQKALQIELLQRGLKADLEVPININYKGYSVGQYRADMIVEGVVIVELKSIHFLLGIHEIQLVNYLMATGIDHGILVNYGPEKVDIARKWRVYTPTKRGAEAT